jgi:hypothetical protein
MDMQLLMHRDVGDFVIGAAIRRADGLLVSGFNTSLDRVTVSSHPAETASVRFTIDSLTRLAGGYIVQMSVHDVTGSEMTSLLRRPAFTSTTSVGTSGYSRCTANGSLRLTVACPVRSRQATDLLLGGGGGQPST